MTLNTYIADRRRHLRSALWTVLLVTISMGRALACGPEPMALPDDCDLYRLMPYHAELAEPDYGRREANCRAWMATVKGVTAKEVMEAVYGLTLRDWLRVGQGDDRGNAFCRRLIETKDNDAIRLLTWSKYYEQWSEEMRSPWYYSCGMDEAEGISVDTIVAVASHNNGRYADRYMLLAMKCLYRSGRNEECEALWQSRNNKIKGSHLADQAEGYRAACLHRMGRTQEAIDIYTRIGDAASLALLCDDKAEVLERVFRSHPNSPFFPIALQRVLFVVENYAVSEQYIRFNLDTVQLQRLLALCQRAGKDTRVSNRAMWLYTAACLLDWNGQPKQALATIESVRSGDAFLNNSLRILRMHLHAQTDEINDEYEQRLFAELKWLDGQIMNEWTTKDSTTKSELCSIDFYAYDCYRTLYSLDALRRIVLQDGGLYDRMVAAGRKTRALQLANMADNRIMQLTQISRRDTGYYGGTYNWHDYGCVMFIRADRLTGDDIAAYWQRVKQPRDDMDRWLNKRGYTDKDYWTDIIGTHYLREMSFAKAAGWLAQTDTAYTSSLNTAAYMCFDPFAYEEKEWPAAKSGEYKLAYARRMAEAAKRMADATDANNRADAMLEMSIGLRNAFSQRCWPLVAYGYHDYTWEEPEPDSWRAEWEAENNQPYERPTANSWGVYPDAAACKAVTHYAREATKRAVELRRQAFATYTAPDRKAQGLRRVFEFTYLMQHYADTPTGQDIARRCDQWRDYRRSTPAVSSRR